MVFLFLLFNVDRRPPTVDGFQLRSAVGRLPSF
jgi:hypothetical protein